MALANGAIFAGYTIQRLLGAGGMGEVYLAHHPRLPRLDALKILPAALTEDGEFRQRFNREADLAAALWHPHIVGLHDRGEFEGQLWITMDYVDGTDAGRLQRQHYPDGLPEWYATEIVTAVADALDYAHQRKLLHRDVKPANILLTGSEVERHRILLADFGIARRTDDISGLTATNMTVGSVAYAAPEQLMGESIDGRADEYALAATAFHLLAGAPPFQHSNPAVVISRHLNAPPPRLAERRPELARLDPVLSKALAKNPSERYPRCLDFAHALRACIAGAAPYPDANLPSNIRPLERVSAVGGPAGQAPITQPAMPSSYHRTMHVPSPQRPALRAATVVPMILAVLLFGAAGFAVTQVLRPDPQPSTAAPQWQPYVDYAKQFTVWFTSISAQSADSDIQRILDGSTGSFHDDFANRRSDFRQTLVNSNVSTQGTVNSAGLDSINGTTAHVLIAATSKVTNNAGASQDPRSWRLDVQVEKAGDTYKVSRVDFVQ
ncbi:serine/threonine-protein kinase [Mycobacterium sp. IS-1264]|uniref:serine/threonine-protein kinase n=1 Tax=Mycobacterium sp. IS-1264 TaxID=1834158 RepID=UPI00096E39CA|nr:serine/threonine-protein kinase [Mycobacterium sp. IS-1264]OMC44465.1 protein kinase [Mycobacterium sp. IS-1264]